MLNNIKLYILGALCAVFLIVAGIATGFALYYRGNAATYKAQSVHFYDQTKTLSASLQAQNNSIKALQNDQNALNTKILAVNGRNAKLNGQLTQSLKIINQTKIGSTCKDSMDYLKQQAAGLSHP